MEPTALRRFVTETAADTAVILGGRDGFLRRFYSVSEDDDATVWVAAARMKPRVTTKPLKWFKRMT